MLVPSGYTESGVLSTMTLIIGRIAPRYTFYGYTVDDIKQESFMICMDALERFDPERGALENFLSFNLSNRLRNFVRDTHKAQQGDDRAKIAQPGQLDGDNYIIDDHEESLSPEDQMDYLEVSILINTRLPASMRADYLKMQNDVYVPKPRKDEIIEEIRNIVSENSNA